MYSWLFNATHDGDEQTARSLYTLLIHYHLQIALHFSLGRDARRWEQQEEIATILHINPHLSLLPEEGNNGQRHGRNHHTAHQVLQKGFRSVTEKECQQHRSQHAAQANTIAIPRKDEHAHDDIHADNPTMKRHDVRRTSTDTDKPRVRRNSRCGARDPTR